MAVGILRDSFEVKIPRDELVVKWRKRYLLSECLIQREQDGTIR
jgi:hypothetical protein